jgi:hypothetical protein
MTSGNPGAGVRGRQRPSRHRPSRQHGHAAAVAEAPPDSGRCRSVRFGSDLYTAPRRPPKPSGRHRQLAAVPEPPWTASQCPQARRAVRRTPWSGQPVGWRFRRRRGPAGGGLCPLPQPAGVHGRSATGGRHVPALLKGAAAVSAVDSGRTAGCWPDSQTHRGHCRGVRFRGHLLGFRARSAQPADIDGPDAWTADAACGHRQPAGARRCGHPRLRQGRADTTATRRAGQPAAEPSTATPNVRPGTGPECAASASTSMA